jgi:hypothetical protein
MRPAQELELAELARGGELGCIQELPCVHGGLHHHVDLAAAALRLDDLHALVDRRRHRHRARDVLSRVQAGQRHRRVRGDRRVDVHRVHHRVGEQLLIAVISTVDSELVADLLQLLRAALADGVQLGVRVALVDRQKLRPEPEPDDRDADRHCATFIIPCITRQCPGKVQMYG